MLHNYLLRTKKSKSIICLFTFHFDILCHISFQPHFCHHEIHQTKTSNWLPIHPHSHSISTTCTYPHHQPQSCHLDLHSYPIIFSATPYPPLHPQSGHPDSYPIVFSVSYPSPKRSSIVIQPSLFSIQYASLTSHMYNYSIRCRLSTSFSHPSNYFTYNLMTTEQQITQTAAPSLPFLPL